MADKFITAHVGAKKDETRVNGIFPIKQYPGEGLRNFVAQFNRVRMTLPNVSEGMDVTAFQNGLSIDSSRVTRKPLSRLMKYPPASWDEINNAYCVEVRADDDDLNGLTRRLTSMASLGPDQELTGTTEECGHKIEDYIALRLEVVNLLQQGHLKELLIDKGRNTLARGRERLGPPKPPSPARTINMIIGGCDEASINDIKFTATHKLKRSIIHERYDGLEESIISDESDADDLTFPHNNALVISLQILDADVKRNMVDDGSGACIIHLRVLTQMRLEDKIVSRCIILTDFNNEVERTYV
nr:uncharacterized protein LOC104097787 [Nicotiana tomentosiformis]